MSEQYELFRKRKENGGWALTTFGWGLLIIGMIGATLGMAIFLTEDYNSPQQQALRNFNISSIVGPSGPPGPSGVGLGFAHFYALMPGDNSATIALGAPVLFPQNGAVSTMNPPTRTGPGTFILPDAGSYKISFQVSVDEAGQLMVKLNGIELAFYTVGRATGTTQFVNTVILNTTTAGQSLEIVNPSTNTAALTITPIAGGPNSVSASLTIKRIS
jgi:hypothetical protein